MCVCVFYNGNRSWYVIQYNIVLKVLIILFIFLSNCPFNTSSILCVQFLGPIWLSHVVCTGSEPSIINCTHSVWNSTTGCTHANDIGVVCSDSKLLLVIK